MSGGKRNHEEISHMMALVEAARKVRATTATVAQLPVPVDGSRRVKVARSLGGMLTFRPRLVAR